MIILYGIPSCNKVRQLKELAQQKQIPYIFQDITNPDKYKQLVDMSDKASFDYPVVYYNDSYIGSYTELVQLINQ